MCFSLIFRISARKLLSIRLFDDSTGKRWQRSVKDENLELLCVSQFTLYNRLKGNKPDFHLAMQGADASNLYNSLLKRLGEQYSEDKVKGIEEVVVDASHELKLPVHYRWSIWCYDASAYTK